jgi:hypothetical protein
VAVAALRTLLESRADERLLAGERWQDTGLVFTAHLGTALDAGNIRTMFEPVCQAAGSGDGRIPRELRISFVSLMSDRGVSIEEIARLAGRASTRTTEVVYRRELRPVITTGAEIMDEVFGASYANPRPAVAGKAAWVTHVTGPQQAMSPESTIACMPAEARPEPRSRTSAGMAGQ